MWLYALEEGGEDALAALATIASAAAAAELDLPGGGDVLGGVSDGRKGAAIDVGLDVHVGDDFALGGVVETVSTRVEDVVRTLNGTVYHLRADTVYVVSDIVGTTGNGVRRTVNRLGGIAGSLG